MTITPAVAKTIVAIKVLLDELPDEETRAKVLEVVLANRCRQCLDYDPNGQFWCCYESREYP